MSQAPRIACEKNKSNLKLFYRLFTDFVCHILLVLGLNASLKAISNYGYATVY